MSCYYADPFWSSVVHTAVERPAANKVNCTPFARLYRSVEEAKKLRSDNLSTRYSPFPPNRKPLKEAPTHNSIPVSSSVFLMVPTRQTIQSMISEQESDDETATIHGERSIVIPSEVRTSFCVSSSRRLFQNDGANAPFASCTISVPYPTVETVGTIWGKSCPLDYLHLSMTFTQLLRHRTANARRRSPTREEEEERKRSLREPQECTSPATGSFHRMAAYPRAAEVLPREAIDREPCPVPPTARPPCRVLSETVTDCGSDEMWEERGSRRSTTAMRPTILAYGPSSSCVSTTVPHLDPRQRRSSSFSVEPRHQFINIHDEPSVEDSGRSSTSRRASSCPPSKLPTFTRRTSQKLPNDGITARGSTGFRSGNVEMVRQSSGRRRDTREEGRPSDLPSFSSFQSFATGFTMPFSHVIGTLHASRDFSPSPTPHLSNMPLEQPTGVKASSIPVTESVSPPACPPSRHVSTSTARCALSPSPGRPGRVSTGDHLLLELRISRSESISLEREMRLKKESSYALKTSSNPPSRHYTSHQVRALLPQAAPTSESPAPARVEMDGPVSTATREDSENSPIPALYVHMESDDSSLRNSTFFRPSFHHRSSLNISPIGMEALESIFEPSQPLWAEREISSRMASTVSASLDLFSRSSPEAQVEGRPASQRVSFLQDQDNSSMIVTPSGPPRDCPIPSTPIGVYRFFPHSAHQESDQPSQTRGSESLEPPSLLRDMSVARLLRFSDTLVSAGTTTVSTTIETPGPSRTVEAKGLSALGHLLSDRSSLSPFNDELQLIHDDNGAPRVIFSTAPLALTPSPQASSLRIQNVDRYPATSLRCDELHEVMEARPPTTPCISPAARRNCLLGLPAPCPASPATPLRSLSPADPSEEREALVQRPFPIEVCIPEVQTTSASAPCGCFAPLPPPPRLEMRSPILQRLLRTTSGAISPSPLETSIEDVTGDRSLTNAGTGKKRASPDTSEIAEREPSPSVPSTAPMVGRERVKVPLKYTMEDDSSGSSKSNSPLFSSRNRSGNFLSLAPAQSTPNAMTDAVFLCKESTKSQLRPESAVSHRVSLLQMEPPRSPRFFAHERRKLQSSN